MSKNKNEESIPCKVILVGNSGVGKTSIINRYLDNYNPEEKSTIGASFSSRKRLLKDIELVLIFGTLPEKKDLDQLIKFFLKKPMFV